jgi:hypothetical protein
VPVAVNCCVAPFEMVVVPGETAIDSSVGAVTVSTAVLLVMLPDVAVMLELPTPRPVATPLALIEATAALAEFQVAEFVRSCVLLSVYVPVAVNDCVSPLPIEALLGATAMDFRVGAVTVSTAVLLVMLPDVAVMLELPTPTPVATPLALMDATATLAEFQVAEFVRSCVLLSVYVPVAVNDCVSPLAIEALVGVTAMETSVGAVTVSTAVLLVMPFDRAVMFDVPTPSPVVTPLPVIEATAPLLEFQVAKLVRSCVLLSV